MALNSIRNDLTPFCDSDLIFAICRSLETGTKDRIINAVVSQQSASANLTFYKFMPFCRNYHISLTAFITALFFLLVISCSRFEWNVDFDHDIIPEIRTMQIFFFTCLQCLYSVFSLLQKYFPCFFFNQWQYSFNCRYVSKHLTFGLLICTLISENPGLQKSRSVSNCRKISGPANLDFFF